MPVQRAPFSWRKNRPSTTRRGNPLADRAVDVSVVTETINTASLTNMYRFTETLTVGPLTAASFPGTAAPRQRRRRRRTRSCDSRRREVPRDDDRTGRRVAATVE